MLQEQDKLLTELRSTLGITDAQNHVRHCATLHAQQQDAQTSFPSLQWLGSESSFCMGSCTRSSGWQQFL